MEQSFEKVLDAADKAIRFPHSAMRIAELAADQDNTNDEIISLIEADPSFSIRILKRVNSAAYSMGVEVACIKDAVTRLGRREISDIAITQATAGAFDNMESRLMKATTFWEHSRTVALLSRELENHHDESDCLAFVGGLLHDIGLLILFHEMPDQMEDTIKASLDIDQNLVEAEQDIIGFNHALLGATLCEKWHLPKSISTIIQHHHEPKHAEDFNHAVTCVALANQIEADPEIMTDDCQNIYEYATPIIKIQDINVEKMVKDCKEKSKKLA